MVHWAITWVTSPSVWIFGHYAHLSSAFVQVTGSLHYQNHSVCFRYSAFVSAWADYWFTLEVSEDWTVHTLTTALKTMVYTLPCKSMWCIRNFFTDLHFAVSSVNTSKHNTLGTPDLFTPGCPVRSRLLRNKRFFRCHPLIVRTLFQHILWPLLPKKDIKIAGSLQRTIDASDETGRASRMSSSLILQLTRPGRIGENAWPVGRPKRICFTRILLRKNKKKVFLVILCWRSGLAIANEIPSW